LRLDLVRANTNLKIFGPNVLLADKNLERAMIVQIGRRAPGGLPCRRARRRTNRQHGE